MNISKQNGDGSHTMNVKSRAKSVGYYKVMATYTTAPNYSTPMETYRSTPSGNNNIQSSNATQRQNSSESNSPRGHVSFTKPNREEEKEKRQKYLTARYGQHQMMLIRKRLAVEDWIYEQLRTLYCCEGDADDHDCNLDLEDLLNLDSDNERREHCERELASAKQSQDEVKTFIDELLRKASTL